MRQAAATVKNDDCKAQGELFSDKVQVPYSPTKYLLYYVLRLTTVSKSKGQFFVTFIALLLA